MESRCGTKFREWMQTRAMTTYSERMLKKLRPLLLQRFISMVLCRADSFDSCAMPQAQQTSTPSVVSCSSRCHTVPHSAAQFHTVSFTAFLQSVQTSPKSKKQATLLAYFLEVAVKTDFTSIPSMRCRQQRRCAVQFRLDKQKTVLTVLAYLKFDADAFHFCNERFNWQVGPANKESFRHSTTH